MKTLNIVKAERKEGHIVYNIDNGDGNLEEKSFVAVRAGFSWPAANSPGYFCIVGEKSKRKTRFQGERERPGKFILLAEHKSSSPFLENILPQLTDMCSLFLSESVFTDLSEEHEEEIQRFREWVNNEGGGHGALCEAPYSSSIILGIGIIKRYLSEGLLILPEDSIAREEMKKSTVNDLETSEKERLYAVAALAFVISAFHKLRPSNLVGWRPNRY